MNIVIYFELILSVYFLYVTSYSFILSVAASTIPIKTAKKSTHKNKFLVLIPAYKEDKVIIEVALDALKQNYPKDYYEVVVIADTLKSETVAAINSIGVKCIEVNFTHSTKVKSLNVALSNYSSADFDIAVILDADNIMEKNFLIKVNDEFENGTKVIQGQRIAKNLDSSFAILDAISEHVNNYIIRKGTTALNLSSSLIGSAMAFEFDLLKTTLIEMNSIGGFDRELELRLIEVGHKVKYLKSALVYDEKVSKSEVFKNQRRRWVSSQFIYLKKYFRKGLKMLFQGNLAYFNSAILRNIQLPRILNLGLMIVLSIISLILPQLFMFPKLFWIYLFLFFISIIAGIPKSLYTKKTFFALLSLPKAFFIMFILLFKLRGANKRFIHTPHG